MYFDLEFVPHIVDKPREITLTLNPASYGGSGMAGRPDAVLDST